MTATYTLGQRYHRIWFRGHTRLIYKDDRKVDDLRREESRRTNQLNALWNMTSQSLSYLQKSPAGRYTRSANLSIC